MMTVRELIEHLAQFDGDKKVKLWDPNFGSRDIEFVEVDEVEIDDTGTGEEAVVIE